jgi:hypothetical protein
MWSGWLSRSGRDAWPCILGVHEIMRMEGVPRLFLGLMRGLRPRTLMLWGGWEGSIIGIPSDGM